MAETIQGAVRILDLSADVILDLSQNGYVLDSWSDDEEIGEEQTTESGWVDGDEALSYREVAKVIEVSIGIEAASWPQVEARFLAMKSALKSQPRWLLERELQGVTTRWRARRPLLISAPVGPAELINNERTVTFRVVCQPTASISGLPEEP